MAGAVGTLQILIEGDASGLNSQLQKAGKNVQSFVSSMNDQQVNWAKILAGTISPAIISGIAATFALAIAQAVSFQSTMATVSNNSGTQFSDNLGTASQAALNLQASTGQSASAIAQSLGMATRALGDYAAGQDLVGTASKYALSTGIDLQTLVGDLIPVMQQWQIPAADMSDTITKLFGIAAQGKVPIDQLLATLANTGAILHTKTTIDTTAASLEAFSNQAGMTGDSASRIFTTVAGNLLDVATAANNTVLGMGGFSKQIETIKTSGMAGLLADMEKSMKGMGDSTAAILATHVGFSPTDTANIISADKGFADMVKNMGLIEDKATSIGQKIENTLGPSQKLQVAWGQIKTDLEPIGSTILDTLTAALNELHELINPDTPADKAFNQSLKPSNVMKAAGQNFLNFFGLGQNNNSTAQTPAGTTNSTVYNYNTTNISSGALSNNKGVQSLQMDAAAYTASQK